MADTHPFRLAADVVDGNVTEGGVTETFLDAMKKRTALALGPTESLGDFDFSVGSPPFAVVYGATGYVYFYNADDTTSPDDGLTVLVSADGRRYILADASAIAVSSVLAIDNDPPASPVDGDAYVVDVAPTGAWVGHANDIALRTPRDWVFAQPQVGATLLNQETGLNIQFSESGDWGPLSPTYPDGSVAPEALAHWGGLSVEAQQNAPPGTPAEGEYYLVGTSPSGAWTGHENDIAYYTSTSTWAFLAAYDGARISNKAADTNLTWFDSTGDWRAPFPISWVCQARLTLETGVAISTADQTAKATLYLTPFRGNNIAVYVAGGWALRAFTEKSLSLAGYTTGKPYDIFAYDNSGVVAIESLVWTNDSTRATALASQDGILVKSGDATRRYVGTIYTTATGQTEDSAARRMVWNYYNRVARPMRVLEATTSWSYASAVYRQARASSANQLDFVIGVAEDLVDGLVNAVVQSGGIIAIGLDSTSAPATGSTIAEGVGQDATNDFFGLTAMYRGVPAVGRHLLVWLEKAALVSSSFRGVSADIQSGMHATILG